MPPVEQMKQLPMGTLTFGGPGLMSPTKQCQSKETATNSKTGKEIVVRLTRTTWGPSHHYLNETSSSRGVQRAPPLQAKHYDPS